jgi:N-acetylneuraminic acid mutarotase
LAGAAFGGNVYAIGGTNNTGYLSTLERYNAATNVWSTLPSMPTPRADLAAAAAPCHETTGTCLYALGGFNGAAVLATVEEYNPATNAWTTETPMPTARGLLAAAAGAHIYAIGGNIGSPIAFNSVVLNVVEQYNPPTNTWVTLAAMPTARAALGAAAFNGNVYAAGGFANKVFLTTFERYNVASNTWATLTPMPTGRDGLAVEAAPCPGSTAICVYAGGGFNGITDVGTLEAYG